MQTIKELIDKAKEIMNKDKFEEFLKNTIETCGYNSDTYELLNNLSDKAINPTKYKNQIENNLKECAKSYFQDENIVNNIKFKDNLEDLKAEVNGIIPDEDLDSILFDANVSMVDDYFRYNKLNGLNVVDNTNQYLDTFKSGMEKIDNSKDYESIKEDVFNDAGYSIVGFDDLDKDTSFENQLENDLADLDLELDLENDLSM